MESKVEQARRIQAARLNAKFPDDVKQSLAESLQAQLITDGFSPLHREPQLTASVMRGQNHEIEAYSLTIEKTSRFGTEERHEATRPRDTQVFRDMIERLEQTNRDNDAVKQSHLVESITFTAKTVPDIVKAVNLGLSKEYQVNPESISAQPAQASEVSIPSFTQAKYNVPAPKASWSISTALTDKSHQR